MDDKLIKEINGNVAYIWINRPDKKNALDSDVWFGLPKIIEEINNSDEANCIVISGKGDSFSAGIDITMFMSDMNLNENLSSTPQERRELMDLVERMQGAFTTIANSKIPTIALAHGFCIGGATSLVSACDIRLATKDAKFSIGETKLGLVADVGVIQRMPKIVSSGDMNELHLQVEYLTVNTQKKLDLSARHMKTQMSYLKQEKSLPMKFHLTLKKLFRQPKKH